MSAAPNLPDEILAWHSNPELDFIGTWATTRYPEDAEVYVKKDAFESLQAENERLREELGQLDADLDTRMAALGMVTLSQLLSEPPTQFSVHVACNSLDFFVDWVERKHKEFLTMRLRYETGGRSKNDDLFEWVFAHAATFGEVHDHLRAALAGEGEG